MEIKNIPDVIRNRINEKGMTVKAVAERSGIKPSMLSQILHHSRKISALEFASLCRVLDLTMENFVAFSNNEKQ